MDVSVRCGGQVTATGPVSYGGSRDQRLVASRTTALSLDTEESQFLDFLLNI